MQIVSSVLNYSPIVTSAAAEVPFKPSAARLPTSAAEVINIQGWKVRDEYLYTTTTTTTRYSERLANRRKAREVSFEK